MSQGLILIINIATALLPTAFQPSSAYKADAVYIVNDNTWLTTRSTNVLFFFLEQQQQPIVIHCI
jgi:hypothetical protein